MNGEQRASKSPWDEPEKTFTYTPTGIKVTIIAEVCPGRVAVKKVGDNTAAAFRVLHSKYLLETCPYDITGAI